MFQKDLFKDQVALVTGGRSGIGYAISKQLLSLGATVFIASRKEELVNKAAENLSQFGTCYAFTCDIRNSEQRQALADFIKSKSGSLDILVNNAGGQFLSLAEDISENGWNAVINSNLNGTFFMTRLMAEHFFIPQKKGIIINMIINIYRGMPGMAHSAAARAGVDNLTKTLAIEWAKYDIRINAIAPGVIKSSGLKNYPPEVVKGISDKIPMKRLGSVEEVGWLTLFLASPMATFITGETIYIDGGQRLWGSNFEI